MEPGWHFAVLFVVVYTSISVLAQNCTSIPGAKCKCAASNKFVVDLNKLSGRSFSAVDPQKSNDIYYFQPCAHLTTPLQCANLPGDVSVCQNNGGNYYDAGNVDKGSFATGDPATDTLVYSLQSEDTPRTSMITLICSDEDSLEFSSENPIQTYNFKLYTTVSCVNGVPQKAKGLSAGSILVILFFVFFTVYWIAGFLLMKFARKAEGVEVIPNYEFWKELPLLIRDGFVFTARGCKGETTYEKI